MPSPIPVEIVEIHGRSKTGYSAQPFLCTGEDGRTYFVKLGNATYRGLMCEWVAGRLAQKMGLPIAEFSLVSVSPSLHRALPLELREIGHGVGFGSVAAPAGACDCTMGMVRKLRENGRHNSLFKDLLAFDLWIRNEDRKLGDKGGNPNALTLLGLDGEVDWCLIDHDSAFDPNFDEGRYFCDHLAAETLTALWNVTAWRDKAESAKNCLDQIWDELPEEWLVDSYGDPRLGLNLSEVETILSLPFKQESTFWNQLLP